MNFKKLTLAALAALALFAAGLTSDPARAQNPQVKFDANGVVVKLATVNQVAYAPDAKATTDGTISGGAKIQGLGNTVGISSAVAVNSVSFDENGVAGNKIVLPNLSGASLIQAAIADGSKADTTGKIALGGKVEGVGNGVNISAVVAANSLSLGVNARGK